MPDMQLPWTLPDLAGRVRQEVATAGLLVITDRMNPVTTALCDGEFPDGRRGMGWLLEKVPDPYPTAGIGATDPTATDAPPLRSRTELPVSWILRQALDDGVLTTSGDSLDAHVSAWLVAVAGQPGQTFGDALAAADALLDPRPKASPAEVAARVEARASRISRTEMLSALDVLTAAAEHTLAKTVTLTPSVGGYAVVTAVDDGDPAAAMPDELADAFGWAQFDMVRFVADQAHALEGASDRSLRVNLERVNLWAWFASSLLAVPDPVEQSL